MTPQEPPEPPPVEIMLGQGHAILDGGQLTYDGLFDQALFSQSQEGDTLSYHVSLPVTALSIPQGIPPDHIIVLARADGQGSRPLGACCFTDGTCQVVTQDNCVATGGQYMGDETTCNPNPCPQPPIPIGVKSWGQIKQMYK